MARPIPESAQVVKQRRDAALNAIVEGVPYIRFLNIDFDRRGDELTGVLNFDQKLIGNPLLPALHGGVTAAFLEVTAVITLSWDYFLPRIESGEMDAQDILKSENVRFPKTVDFTVDYLRSGLPRDAYARAFISRAGRRYASVRVEAWQDNHARPYAQASGHFLMPQSKPEKEKP